LVTPHVCSTGVASPDADLEKLASPLFTRTAVYTVNTLTYIGFTAQTISFSSFDHS